MKMEECYALFGGNYADVKSRLMKDELIKKFVIKFLSDPSYEQLEEAINQQNHKNAFLAVHTLKGLSKNFSFDRLSSATEQLTETLRNWESAPVDETLCEEQWKRVSAEYLVVTDVIKKYVETEVE